MLASTAYATDEYTLVFSDEFDGDTLDPARWNTGFLWGPYVPINNEQQMYIDTLGMHLSPDHDPFTVSNGTLKITAVPKTSTVTTPPRPPEKDPVWGGILEYRYNGPTVDPDTGETDPGWQESEVEYFSGIITSYDTFRMTHGYVEARMKLPPGQGLWPAFWMLNTHYLENSPEIDVVEFLGHDTSRIYHSYHYFDPQNGYAKVSTYPTPETIGPDWTADFHTFGMAWSPRQITWFVDGQQVHQVTDQEFKISKQAMYLLANLAVGGNWPGDADGTTPFPATLEIDYIRAYKKKLAEPINLAADFQLMFSDEFETGQLDASKWDTNFLWGPYLIINQEDQYYVDTLGIDAGSSVNPFQFGTTPDGSGMLSITAEDADPATTGLPPAEAPGLNDPIWLANGWNATKSRASYMPPNTPLDFTSGIITSRDAFKFVQGYAEMRAKLPAGDGLWPAFWLLNAYYVGPQPEIDIMEARGSAPTEIVHSYHSSNTVGQIESSSKLTTGSTDYTADFHTYGVHWEPTRIRWFIDGQLVHQTPTLGRAYQMMYVLANLAVGGEFPYRPPVPGSGPASLDIDYIRVYQHKDLNLPPNAGTPSSNENVALHSSCLAGNGRVDLNIVNESTASSVYRLELQSLSARAVTVTSQNWGRISITGRPPASYSAVVKRDGQPIIAKVLSINCNQSVPTVSEPEVTIVNACRANNGYVLFQFVNPTSATRPYVIEFQGVPNRSTSALAFGQSVRATSGRPDGTYSYLVRSGSTTLKTGQITVNCD